MAWTITFKNRKNETCVVSIAGGTGTLTPAAEPFRVQMDDDDDIFKPVRTSSGNIKIVDASISTIKSIMCATPLERAVTLTVTTASGTTTTAWMGFVKCEAFEQTLFGYNEEFSIPIMDCLSALEGVYVDDTNWSSNEWLPVSDLLTKINGLIGNPYTINYSTLNPWSVNKLNWIEEKSVEDAEVGKIYDGKSYLNVLKDVCQYMMRCAVAEGTTLHILPLNSKPIGSSAAELKDKTFTGTDHTVGIVSGKGRITASVDPNVQSGTVVSFDDTIKRLKLTSNVVGVSVQTGISYRDRYECRFQDTDGLFASVNSGVTPSDGIINSGIFGVCGIEYEGVQSRTGDDTTKHPSTFDFLKPALVIVSNPQQTSDFNSATFNIPLVRTIKDSQQYKVTAKVEVKGEPNEWWNSQTCRLMVKSSMDGSYREITCIDGKLEDKINAQCSSYSILAHDPQGQWVYARITDFKIEYWNKYSNSYGIDITEGVETFTKTEDLNNGLQEEYSIEQRLAGEGSYQSITSQTTLKACGRGFVQYPLSPGPGTKGVAVSTINVAKSYYSQSRSRLCVTIESSTYLSPATSYTFEGTTYNIIAQELNARDCELKLTLQEAI